MGDESLSRQHRGHLDQGDLDALLKMLAEEDDFSSLLSPAIIDDYVHGRAEGDDQTLVESAMAQSSTIRARVLALAVVAQRGGEFAALEPPKAPPRQGLPDQETDVFRLFRFRPSRRLVWMALPGIAASALILWILRPISHGPPSNTLPLYSAVFDRTLVDEQFEPDLRRTIAPEGSSIEPRNARDAALLSFFQVIEWHGEDFLIQPVPPEVGGTREYSLVFELEGDGDASTSWTYEVLLPGESKEPQTAILVFPSLDLHWVDSTAWDGRVSFRQDSGQTLFVTVTYQVGGEHAASAPTMMPSP